MQATKFQCIYISNLLGTPTVTCSANHEAVRQSESRKISPLCLSVVWVLVSVPAKWMYLNLDALAPLCVSVKDFYRPPFGSKGIWDANSASLEKYLKIFVFICTNHNEQHSLTLEPTKISGLSLQVKTALIVLDQRAFVCRFLLDHIRL